MHPVLLDLRLDMIQMLSTILKSSEDPKEEGSSSSNLMEVVRSFEFRVHIDKLLVKISNVITALINGVVRPSLGLPLRIDADLCFGKIGLILN